MAKMDRPPLLSQNELTDHRSETYTSSNQSEVASGFLNRKQLTSITVVLDQIGCFEATARKYSGRRKTLKFHISLENKSSCTLVLEAEAQLDDQIYSRQ